MKHHSFAAPRLVALSMAIVLLASGLTVLLTVAGARPAAAAGPTSVRPNGDPTNYGFFTPVGCGSAWWDCIDDDPDSPDDTGYLEGSNNTGGAGWLDLGAMPTDFVSATSVDMKVRHMENGTGDDTVGGYYRIVPSDQVDANALTSETAINPVPTSWTTSNTTVTPSGTNTKASWDGAQLKLGTGYTLTGGADVTTKLRVSAAEVNITYTSSQTAKLAQVRYIWENDDGTSVDTNTQQAASNTAITGVKQGERLTLRTQLKNTGGATAPATEAALFYDRNDGIWSKVRSSAPTVTAAGSCTDTNFECTMVDSSGTVGADSSMAVDPTGAPWIAYYDSTSGDLNVSRYVGSGGTGCASTAWRCATVDGTVDDVGRETGIAFDRKGTAWISYYDFTNQDLKVAKYVGQGGTGCATTEWTCVAVDSTGNVGNWTSIAIDSSGSPWVSYRQAGSDNDLRVARYVVSGGTGCVVPEWRCVDVSSANSVGDYGTSIVFDVTGAAWVSFHDATATELVVAKFVGSGGIGCTTGDWDCTRVDPTTGAVGKASSLAIDSSGKPWISYYDTTNTGLRVAQYVGSGGTGCRSGAWTCQGVDSANDRGLNATRLAFDPAGSPWIAYYDDTAGTARIARYVGSGGTGCDSASWHCTALGTSGTVDAFGMGLAFAADGRAWISWNNDASDDLEVAMLNRGGEITTSAGLAGTNGATISESHGEMNAFDDTMNRDDVDCSGGGTWNNGKWFEAEHGTALGLADGSVTPTCTEVAFVIDTSKATAGTTYRFVLATNDGISPDRSRWRGPITISAYPTLTIETAPEVRYSKDSHPALSSCTDGSWGCADIDNLAGVRKNPSLAFDQQGSAWVAYEDTTNSDLWIGKYVGTGGTGCASAAWHCYAIDQSGAVGGYSSMAIDPAGQPWVAYRDANSGDGNLKVARFVGSGGSCASTAWTCTTVETTGDVAIDTAIAFDHAGAAWVTYWDQTNYDLRLARYSGEGAGTGCASADWTCSAIDTQGSTGTSSSISFGPDGVAWIGYLDTTNAALRVARHVGVGGTGCAIASWTCITVDNTNIPGSDVSMAIGADNAPWIAYRDDINRNIRVARSVGSGGTGCATLTWHCITLDSANDKSGRPSVALDAQGNPWISYRDSTDSNLRVARYVGGTAGTGCDASATAWRCISVQVGGNDWQTSLAFDGSGTPWVAFRDFNVNALRVARLYLPPTPPTAGSAVVNNGRNATRGDGRYRLDHGDSPRSGTAPCGANGDADGYCGSASSDGETDSIVTGAWETPAYTFVRRFPTNTAAPMATWVGRSSVAPSSRAIVLWAYRFGTTNDWEQLNPYGTDTCASAAANTSCTISDTAGGTASEYFESDGAGAHRSYIRVTQPADAAGVTFRTDHFQYNRAPNAPTTLVQKKTDDSVIATGGWANQVTARFTATISDPDITDSLRLCVEVVPIGSSFVNADNECSAATAYSGTPVTVSVDATLYDNGEFHWQARVRDVQNLPSAFVSYGANAESARDFGTDSTAPTNGTAYDGTTAGVDTNYNTGSLSQLSANWSGVVANISGLSRYDYAIGTTAGAINVQGWTSNLTATSVTATGLTLRTSQPYFFSVRAVDNAGNVGVAFNSNGQTVAPTLTFTVGVSSLDLGNANAGNSFTRTGSHTLTISTNGYGGYAVRARTASLSKATGSVIALFNGGTYALPDNWGAADRGFGYTSSDTLVGGVNKFQATTCPGGSAKVSPGCYSPFASAAPGDIVADNIGPVTGSSIVNDVHTLSYRVSVDISQASGRYVAPVVLGATVSH